MCALLLLAYARGRIVSQISTLLGGESIYRGWGRWVGRLLCVYAFSTVVCGVSCVWLCVVVCECGVLFTFFSLVFENDDAFGWIRSYFFF